MDVAGAVIDGEGGAGALACQDVLDGAIALVHVRVELRRRLEREVSRQNPSVGVIFGGRTIKKTQKFDKLVEEWQTLGFRGH